MAVGFRMMSALSERFIHRHLVVSFPASVYTIPLYLFLLLRTFQEIYEMKITGNVVLEENSEIVFDASLPYLTRVT